MAIEWFILKAFEPRNQHLNDAFSRGWASYCLNSRRDFNGQGFYWLFYDEGWKAAQRFIGEE